MLRRVNPVRVEVNAAKQSRQVGIPNESRTDARASRTWDQIPANFLSYKTKIEQVTAVQPAYVTRATMQDLVLYMLWSLPVKTVISLRLRSVVQDRRCTTVANNRFQC